MSKLRPFIKFSKRVYGNNSSVQILLQKFIKQKTDFCVRVYCHSAPREVPYQSTEIGHTTPEKHESKTSLKPPSLIARALDLKNRNLIKIEWGDGVGEEGSQLFPYVWLRDHCQCNVCFNPISHSRTMLFDKLMLDVNPVEFHFGDVELRVKWSDGHVSVYSSEWLHERGFSDTSKRLKRPSIYKLSKVSWDSVKYHDISKSDFEELLTDDWALLAWLRRLETFGFSMIENAPRTAGQVRKLAERVTFIKKTHYGEEFAVTAKVNPSNVAYSSGPLQLHTDLPYYEYKPGIQLIHCIEQFAGEGAESLLSDGLGAALFLRESEPGLFRALAETPVDWCDVGSDEGRDFFKVLRAPVICTDSDGEISRINFSHPQRDSFFNVDVEGAMRWYEAFKTFHDMLNSSRFCVRFKMTAGSIQSFDNHRIVHGRTSYDASRGSREMEGCYMDWDEARSKRRVLEKKLNK